MRDVLKQFFDLPVPDEGPWADYSSLDYEVNDGLIEQLHEAIENPAVLEGVDGDDVDPIRTHAWRMLVRVGGLSQFDFLLRRLEACEVYDDFAYIDDFSALCQELGEGAIPLLLEKLHDRQPLTHGGLVGRGPS